MTDKSERYIGLVFWLLIILLIWFFDASNLFRVDFKVDVTDSLVGEFVEEIVRNFKIDWGLTFVVGWVITLVIALGFSWKFRALPMRIINKIFKAFHKAV